MERNGEAAGLLPPPTQDEGTKSPAALNEQHSDGLTRLQKELLAYLDESCEDGVAGFVEEFPLAVI
jgi:hypothetical protein